MGNYNAMIAPVLKFPIKGVIWYQGESNDSNPKDYEKLFPLMIQNWRKINGKDFPFIFTQLPIWKNPTHNDENASWAIIRAAQASALTLPLTGMACTLELGEWNDIHPINKKDVGLRLFAAAEKTINSVNNSSPGPIVQRYEIKEDTQGKKLFIYFNNCANGLTAKNAESQQVIGSLSKNDSLVFISIISDNEQVNLAAKIEGANSISVDITDIKNPQKALYAWADNPCGFFLFNSDGLPMLPFKLIINK